METYTVPKPQPPPSPKVLLEFVEPWSQLNTKDASLEKVLKPMDGAETEGLEILRTLDSLRRSAVFEDTLDTGTLEKMQTYVAQLESLTTKLEPMGIPVALQVKWTSPMSGKPSYYYKMDGLACETAMAAYYYGMALHCAAYYIVSDKDLEQCCQETATMLRKAAGVFQWLVDRGIPRIQNRFTNNSDRPTELHIGLARVQVEVCMAEAQMVTAARAEQRGVSPALVCSLHAAAWELWESAARNLKTYTPEFASSSDIFRRYIATCSAVCRARALRSWAAELRTNKQEAGQAEAACVLAASLLQAAQQVAEASAAWRQTIKLELGLVEFVRVQCENDRQHVYFQSVPKAPPDLPPGKLLVNVIPFAPLDQGTQEGDPGPAPPGALLTSANNSAKAAAQLTAAMERTLSLRS